MLVEEAYYWNYSQHLDFSYLDHPPMVALLIKLSTLIFGIHEVSIRIVALLFWGVTAFFSYKLSNLIYSRSGIYAVTLLAILPFFFLQSLMITPDVPMMLCWSALLYYLYRALVLEEVKKWYVAGLWLGLGMLSKYSIALLIPTTFIYLLFAPNAYKWFFRKEIYLSAMIAGVLFTPVIYWNSTHHWISFIFQGSRRLNDASHFRLHELIGLIICFLLPIGLMGLWQLMKTNKANNLNLSNNSLFFLQLYTGVPLLFFALVSLQHNIKINWIGPSLLAIIPWLAILMCHCKKSYSLWMKTGAGLLACYFGLILLVNFNTSEKIQQKVLNKFVDWNAFTQDFYDLAKKIESDTHVTPIFVPLDKYPIASELLFYQAKFLAEGKIKKIYPIIGCHIFNCESLMFRYWSNSDNLADKTLILISTEKWRFHTLYLINRTINFSTTREIWSHSPRNKIAVNPYYYKIVKYKDINGV